MSTDEEREQHEPLTVKSECVAMDETENEGNTNTDGSGVFASSATSLKSILRACNKTAPLKSILRKTKSERRPGSPCAVKHYIHRLKTKKVRFSVEQADERRLPRWHSKKLRLRALALDLDRQQIHWDKMVSRRLKRADLYHRLDCEATEACLQEMETDTASLRLSVGSNKGNEEEEEWPKIDDTGQPKEQYLFASRWRDHSSKSQAQPYFPDLSQTCPDSGKRQSPISTTQSLDQPPESTLSETSLPYRFNSLSLRGWPPTRSD